LLKFAFNIVDMMQGEISLCTCHNTVRWGAKIRQRKSLGGKNNLNAAHEGSCFMMRKLNLFYNNHPHVGDGGAKALIEIFIIRETPPHN
jgi:hypothetical protein